MACALMKLRSLNTFFKTQAVNSSYAYLRPSLPPFSKAIRCMSGDQGIYNIDIDGLKQFQADSSATIIDVREVNEIKETGPLPGSINIPLGTVKDALQENAESFHIKFSKSKPNFDDPLVFSCRSGRRSLMASEAAKSLGFKKVFNYAGGWLDWEEKEKK